MSMRRKSERERQNSRKCVGCQCSRLTFLYSTARIADVLNPFVSISLELMTRQVSNNEMGCTQQAQFSKCWWGIFGRPQKNWWPYNMKLCKAWSAHPSCWTRECSSLEIQSTEVHKMVRSRFGEVCSCCCLPALPGSYFCAPFWAPLYLSLLSFSNNFPFRLGNTTFQS